MKKVYLRRVVAIVVALLLILYALVNLLPVRSSLQTVGYNIGDLLAKHVDAAGKTLNTTAGTSAYLQLVYLGIAVAFGAAIVLLGWERRPRSSVYTICLVIVLALLLPLSFVNLAYEDRLMPILAQALLDLVLVILGIVAFLDASGASNRL